MSTYADTSVFVSLYLPDRHSVEVQRLLTSSTTLWLTPLHRAEWEHVIGQHLWRRAISAAEARKVRRDFERDRRAGLWIETGLPELAFETCISLAERFGPKLGVRTLDSLHVAMALELKADRFWTFDERQRRLAQMAGFDLP